jgi:hypothetical protein
MYVTRKHISRRAVLRGLGVSLALPLLDSMVPAFTALAQTVAAPKTRFVGTFSAHGWSPGYWLPDTEGRITKLPFVSSPLQAHLDRLTIVSGMDATSSMPPPGLSGGDHSRAAAVLSGVNPKKTVGADIYLGETIDQMIARKHGQDTALPSLQLGIEDPGVTSVCPWGYSCAYTNSISWSAPNRPLPHEINPLVVFERLFGDGSNAAERLARKQAQSSMLDGIMRQVARLKTNLPASDRSRLNNYLDDIREIERRLQHLAMSADISPDAEVPFGVPESFDDHIKLMFDLQALAFQADITRVSTLIFARDTSFRSYPESGVTTANHSASHHGEVARRIEDWAKINRYHLQTLAHFIGKLAETPDGDGTLLDHSLILWTTNMGNGNQHSHVNVPHMLIGGASGQHKGGRHIRTTGPTSNILLTTLKMFGIEKDSIGDSTGMLSL